MGSRYLYHLTFTHFKFILKYFIFFEMVSDTMVSLSIFLLKLFLRTIFENRENIILMLFENCSLIFEFSVFFLFPMFFRKKKWDQICSQYFTCSF